ncbi:hypothetical protein D3C76_1846400 [compost metagenome]
MDLQVRGLQQLAGLADPHQINIVGNVHACFFHEYPGNVLDRYPHVRGNLLQS